MGRFFVASSAVVAAVVVLAGCRQDASIDEVVVTDDPLVIDVIVDTCNADVDVKVDETDDEVFLSVRNNDRALFITGGDDCQDLVAVELGSPLGDRRLVLDDGSEITLTTFPSDDEVSP